MCNQKQKKAFDELLFIADDLQSSVDEEATSGWVMVEETKIKALRTAIDAVIAAEQ